MTSERWEQVKAIFLGAVERDSASRANFLKEQCGSDAELRREVEALLASDGEADSAVLEGPIVRAATLAASDERESTVVLKDRYEIVREIGRGGMSMIYLARDRQLLSKQVVIKVLLEESGVDAWMRQKFLQEMEALARVDHPGVVGALDTGVTPDGKQFLVMQYVEGTTLRAAIDPGGMNLVRAAGIIRQIGQALSAVHEKGVWHRDLKPDNIMLQTLGGDDHVKLIDFGIAGIQDSQFGGEKTKVAGSLNYMAPEQFAGKPCEASDTYALAVVAYEMVTGRKPFPTDSMMQLAKEDGTRRTAPHELRHELPEAASRSIVKAMSFRPEQRHSTVREFSEELCRALGGTSSTFTGATAPPAARRRSSRIVVFAVAALLLAAVIFWFVRGRTTGVPERPSIAVLPFVDLSPEKNQQYLSDGLAEELLDGLAKIPELRVAGRRSAFGFKDSSDFRVIGEKLHVASILEGSVRKQANQVRVAVRLIKSADGFQMWSEVFDREMSNIFAVQEEIARAVTGSLKVTLLGQTGVRNPKVDAFNAYLQGRYFLQRSSKENLEKAVSYFDQAIQLDSNYAKAWSLLGEAYSGQAGATYVEPSEGYEKARESVKRALSIDPNLGEAHAAMAWIKQFRDFDWEGSDASYKKALALEPGNATVISHAAILARILGHLDEAVDLGRKAIQIDPLSPGNHHNAGVSLYYAGHYDEANAAFRKALELVPEMERPHLFLGRVHLARGESKEALAEMEKERHVALRLFGTALAYHALGQTAEADKTAADFVQQYGRAYYQIAELYAFRGDVNRAFEYLEKASDPVQIKGDPLLKNIVGDARYTALLKKLRLPL